MALIALFTDFGLHGPYVGQMKTVLAGAAPQTPVIDLLHDAPAFNPRAAGYLLAALARETPAGTVLLSVVDPGVGSERRPLVLRAAGRWFVGPDNGLLNAAARHAPDTEWWEITWRPERLSPTFHGRDLFAPVAAQLARGEPPPGERCGAPEGLAAWPADVAEVVYVDAYGNATTGTRASRLPEEAFLRARDRCFQRVRTFADAPPGTAVWYENSSGLAELAVNQGNAAASCGLAVGCAVTLQPECD